MSTASLPAGLRHLAGTPDGAAWLERVPHLLARARERWGLELGSPFSAGSASWTVLVRPQGDAGWPYVLKVSFPHPEAAREAAALMHWHGRGAPRLVDVDDADWALLMHAVRPGTPLSASLWPQDTALRAGAEVLRTLYATPLGPHHGFGDLGDSVREWASLMTERVVSQAWSRPATDLVERALVDIQDLLATTPLDVLLHGDANPGNFLAGEDEDGIRWCAIDPKPVVGDAAFDLWPMLEQVGAPFLAADVPGELRRRARLVGDVLGIDPQRIARWAFVRRVESNLWLAATTPEADRSLGSTTATFAREWDGARAWGHAVSRGGD